MPHPTLWGPPLLQPIEIRRSPSLFGWMKPPLCVHWHRLPSPVEALFLYPVLPIVSLSWSCCFYAAFADAVQCAVCGRGVHHRHHDAHVRVVGHPAGSCKSLSPPALSSLPGGMSATLGIALPLLWGNRCGAVSAVTHVVISTGSSLCSLDIPAFVCRSIKTEDHRRLVEQYCCVPAGRRDSALPSATINQNE